MLAESKWWHGGDDEEGHRWLCHDNDDDMTFGDEKDEGNDDGEIMVVLL